MQETDTVNIRNGKPSDHEKVISVMPEWWGGRDLSASVLNIFFIHFRDTVYIAEINGELAGFLVGFMSPSEKDVGYIHFVGVHPQFRKADIGRRLYEKFFAACRANNRSVVKCCTSPVNRLSIDFHQAMGFAIVPGDGTIDGVPVTLNYLRADNPKVLFRKELNSKQLP